MKKLKHYILSALFFTIIISQTFEYLQQKKLMEDYYKEQIFDEISTTLLSKNQFTVKVKIELNGSGYQTGETNKQSKITTKSKQNMNSGLDFITGVKRDGSASTPDNSNSMIDLRNKKSAEGSISNIDVFVYLDESQSTGAVKDNIETLVRNIVPEYFADCSDCIQIKSMPFQRQNIDPQSEGGIIEQLKKEIEDLKLAEERRQEKNMQDSLIVLTNQLKILEQIARNQFIQDSLETAFKLKEAEMIVKTKERTDDSLLVTQAKTIDELRKEHTSSLVETKDQLIDVLKNGKQEGEDSGVLGSGLSNSTLIIVIGSIIILLLFIAIILSRKSKVETVYLKPKNKNQDNKPESNKKKSDSKKSDNTKKEDNNIEKTEESENKQPKPETSASNPFLDTQIHQDPNVLQSEVQDLKQSAVSLTVGQKEGATSVIKDWLEDAPKDESESNDDNNEE